MRDQCLSMQSSDCVLELRWECEAVPEEPPVISATGDMGAMVGVFLTETKTRYACSCRYI